MRNREYDHLFKFVIVGNSSVGKSCLLLRFADDQFSENYMTTIGVDFRFKTLNLDQKSIKLQIWDTAGQERFRTITNTYYKSNYSLIVDANAVLMVYDVTSLESFQDIEKYWLNEVESYADPGTQLVLVGNKCDLEDKRAVPIETAKQFAASKNMDFFETSAKTAHQVQ
jgi:Ras-related protein Rab-1A